MHERFMRVYFSTLWFGVDSQKGEKKRHWNESKRKGATLLYLLLYWHTQGKRERERGVVKWSLLWVREAFVSADSWKRSPFIRKPMLDYPNYGDNTLKRNRLRQREDVWYAKGHLPYSNSNPPLISDLFWFPVLADLFFYPSPSPSLSFWLEIKKYIDQKVA